jgi:hypothetical protein
MFLAAYKKGYSDINETTDLSYDDMGGELYERLSCCDVNNLGESEFAAIRLAYLVWINRVGGDYDPKETNVFLKTHSVHASMYGIPLIPSFLTKRAIYLVRDPRDVAVSYAHHTKKSIDETIEVMNHEHALARLDYRFHVLSSWSNHVKSWLNADEIPRHVVRYEDMVEHPHATFKKILEFIDWDFDEDRFNVALEETSFGKLKLQEQEKGFREQSMAGSTFFRKGVVGDWRNVLTSSQEESIINSNLNFMERLGYGRDD